MKGYFNNTTKKLEARDRRFAKLYARMLLDGNVDWVKLGRVYKPHDKRPELKSKQIVRKRYIQNMLNEELIKLYEEAGITKQTVVQEEQRILNDAKTSNNLRIQLDVVQNWRDSLDLKPAKQQQITTTTTDYIKLLDKDQKKQIEAKRTVTNTDNNDEQ